MSRFFHFALPIEMLRKPEFPLFPHKIWRPNPPFLEGSLTHDPWHKVDAWRYHSFFDPKNRIKAMFPGLGLGLTLLGVYVMYDQWYYKKGPGKAEVEKWDRFMKEREQRLHHDHH
jgi:hypothetical protein